MHRKNDKWNCHWERQDQARDWKHISSGERVADSDLLDDVKTKGDNKKNLASQKEQHNLEQTKQQSRTQTAPTNITVKQNPS